MGKETIGDKLRSWIGSMAWGVFLWSIQMTESEYIEYIVEQEDSLS